MTQGIRDSGLSEYGERQIAEVLYITVVATDKFIVLASDVGLGIYD